MPNIQNTKIPNNKSKNTKNTNITPKYNKNIKLQKQYQ